MNQVYKSMSLSHPHPPLINMGQKIFAAIGGIGFLIMVVSLFDGFASPQMSMWLMSMLLMAIGVIGYAWCGYGVQTPGVKNNGVWFSGTMSRGVIGWILGVILTALYVALYWYPQWLGLGQDGAANTGLVALFDPFSIFIKGVPASQWFVYGTLYTLAILIFGVRFIWRYRHNRYQVIRTMSVMGFQLFFAYLIPEILEGLNSKLGTKSFDKDLKNMWPLDYDFFDQWHIDNMSATGMIGWGFLMFSFLLVFVISPILTYKYGKRWYCSWVCGCGGLAETAGDPFRHLSDKSLRAWKLERWMIHSILVFSIVMTVATIYGYLGDGDQYYITRTMFTVIVIALLILVALGFSFFMKKNGNTHKDLMKIIYGICGVIAAVLLINFLTGSGNAFFLNNYTFKQLYGFWIGAAFSGVIGVGFYPLMGSRVWCRFGCPMAAILGLQQKLFSKFRITTNGGQCISCGNCSTYCEMGIDVRSYAQKGQNIVRASCVGCGVCAAVCPRGVLKLENASSDIYEKTIDIRNVHVQMDR